MNRRISLPFICAVVLMATTVQAISPDASDLASLNLFHLIWGGRLDGDPCSRATKPSPEVCGLSRCEHARIIRSVTLLGRDFQFIPVASGGIVSGHRTRGEQCPNHTVEETAHLFDFLCRLIC